MKEYIHNLFALDTRSLAFFRICLWLIILWDLFIWLNFLSAFHTDIWILPHNILFENYKLENIWTIHSISQAYRFQSVLFVVHIGVCISYILWRKTKTSSIILWVLTCSLHAHNPLILNGGDTVTRLMLFWWMFMPVWYSWSLDNKQEKKDPLSLFSIATVWFIIQLAFIYIFGAILKDHPRRHTEFTAVYYAMSLDMFRTPYIGDRLYTQPWLMKFFTWYAYYLESFAFILMILPWKQHRWRVATIFLFVTFHAWLGLNLHLYSFPFLLSVYRLTLTPSRSWDWLFDKIDGTLQTYSSDPTNRLIIKTSEHHPREPDQYTFLHHHASTYIHYFWLRTSLFLIGCLWYIFMRNLRTTDFPKYTSFFPTSINRFWFLTRIDQYRNMFAPFPFTDNGWTVITWTTQSWEQVNMIKHDSPATLDRPTNYKALYPHERRRKLFTSLWLKDNSKYRWHVARYLCHKWNTKNPDNQITDVTWTYMLERTLDDYEASDLSEEVIYTGTCEVIEKK